MDTFSQSFAEVVNMFQSIEPGCNFSKQLDKLLMYICEDIEIFSWIQPNFWKHFTLLFSRLTKHLKNVVRGAIKLKTVKDLQLLTKK